MKLSNLPPIENDLQYVHTEMQEKKKKNNMSCNFIETEVRKEMGLDTV